jgi:type I restriction enzyme M protein
VPGCSHRQPGQDVYDPTCGSGGLLLQVLSEARRLHGDRARQITLFGQELTPETWAMARMNMLLHGAGGAATVVQGDTLAAPAFLEGGQLRRFDLVIANPPFSSKNWGHERFKAARDPFGRIRHLPKKSHGEMAFVQHMVASLADDGRMAVVLPNGCFFRAGAERLVRRDLVEEDIVEAVIQLPLDMFYGATIPACWLILNRAKPSARRGRVLLIDASELFERVDTKNVLPDGDIERIVAAFQSDDVVEGFSAFATRVEIVHQRYMLSPRRYVGGVGTEVDLLSFADALAEFRGAREQRQQAEEQLMMVIDSLNRG